MTLKGSDDSSEKQKAKPLVNYKGFSAVGIDLPHINYLERTFVVPSTFNDVPQWKLTLGKAMIKSETKYEKNLTKIHGRGDGLPKHAHGMQFMKLFRFSPTIASVDYLD